MRSAILFALVVSAAFNSPAGAATRNFGITSFTKVRVDGPFRVSLATGVAPFARATGTPEALDRVAIEGTHLRPRQDRNHRGRRLRLRVSVVQHEHHRNGRQQRRISHRGPDTEADRPDRPDGKALPDSNHSKGDRLDGQPAGDQSLAADSIGERARTHLAEGPDKRVKSDKRADLDEPQQRS